MSRDSQDTVLFLDASSKLKLAAWLYGIDTIPRVNNGRLGLLQLAGTNHGSLKELAAVLLAGRFVRLSSDNAETLNS